MKLTLIKIKPEASVDCLSFQFKPESPVIWKGGQFLRYHLDNPNPDERKTNRYFTISSAPFEEFIQITTRFTKDNGSTFKKNLKNLKIGQTIEAKGPMGIFELEQIEGNQQYIFIAGGIGITPFRSILLQLDHQGSQLPITLLYANRDEQIVFKDELENLKTKHPEFTIEYFVGEKRVDEETLNTILNQYPEAIFYLSGPQPMVEGIQKILEEKLNVPASRIKLDYFPGYSAI